MPSVPVYPLGDGLVYHMGLIGVANLPPVFEVRANKGYISFPTLVPLTQDERAPAPGNRGSSPAKKAPGKPPVKDRP
jgi:hypothetical protein